MVHWRNNCAYDEAVKVRKDTGLGIYSAQNRAGSYTPFGAVLLGCGANSIWNIGEKIAGWCTNDDESSSESSDVQRYKDQIDSILSVHSVGNISELGLLLESKKQELFDKQQLLNEIDLSINNLMGDNLSNAELGPEANSAELTSLASQRVELAQKIEKLTAEVEKLANDCEAVKKYTKKLEKLEQDEYINSQVNANTKNFTDLLQKLNEAQRKGKSDSEIDDLVSQITKVYGELGGDTGAPLHIKAAYGFLKGEIDTANKRKAS